VTVPAGIGIRSAGAGDAETIGQLLHDFNVEFDERTPGPGAIAERVRQLLAVEEIAVLLTATEAHGLVVLRFRPALYGDALDCYVEELYVVPQRRGQGLGRALMEAAIALARRKGAAHMDLGTGEDDTAARALYESLGFNNRGGRPDGPLNYVYEREL
jgi:ribosomal protein S18 acetylase RimI-like enzyme